MYLVTQNKIEICLLLLLYSNIQCIAFGRLQNITVNRDVLRSVKRNRETRGGIASPHYYATRSQQVGANLHREGEYPDRPLKY